MYQVKLSEIGSAEAFAAALEAHRAAVEQHMMGKAGINAPRSSQLIEGLIVRIPDTGPVKERGPDRIAIAEYVIEDDSAVEASAAPPEAGRSEPTLAQLQMQKQHEMQAAAQTAKNALLSPARARLLMSDAAIVHNKAEGDRTRAEAETLASYMAYFNRCQEIDRAVLVAAIELEETTLLTISGWNPPKF